MVFLSSTLLCGQRTFEVVSVKPNLSTNGPSDPRISPERFSWTNVRLRQLIQVAYDMRPHQLVALPEWADSARYDVTATAGFPASPQQMNTMLQGLLADRFGLLVHREKREFPVYALTVARRDGKLGAGLHASAIDCESIAAKPVDSIAAQSEYAACLPQMGLTRLKATGFRMSSLASGLTRILDRSVIDKTGLVGTFDFELSWVPDPTMLPVGAPPPPADGPSIFTAIQEQLGLKLDGDKGPVEVLVIDSVRTPSEN
jgi:uncharacterized protein (TIGR03435 family)